MTTLMTVGNNGPLVDRMGSDCDDMQYIRELTQNSIDGIQKARKAGVLKPGERGEIVWDVDWEAVKHGEPRRLCITDNGIGMTGQEMVVNINQLCPETGFQSLTGNFGVGAKIAAATRNRAGVVYQSWRNGEGYYAEIWRDPQKNAYGLKDVEIDGKTYTYAPLSNRVKPKLIRDHGTRVILRGNSDGDDTALPPPGVENERWLLQYLNNRYFRLPDNIVIRVNESLGRKPKEPVMRPVRPMSAYLADNSDASGVVQVPGAKVRWWILKERTKVGKHGNVVQDMWAYNHVQASSGHVAALFQDELYEMRTGKAGQSAVQGFGVIFGHARVVIYVEPEGDVTANTARTMLLINGRQLPWADYQAAFIKKMPPELKRLDSDAASKASEKDDSKAVEKRIQSIMELFSVTRYRADQDGDARADESSADTCVDQDRDGKADARRPQDSPRPQRPSDFYSRQIKKDGFPASSLSPKSIPECIWTTDDLLKDKAAKWHPEKGQITANQNFRVLDDIVRFCVKQWNLPANAVPACRAEIKDWMKQTLIECVMGIESLRGTSEEWGASACDAALSPEALTAAIMARYNMISAAKQRLTGKGLLRG